MNRINQFAYEYDFLSNFYAVPIRFEEADYASVEHAYQAAKTTDSEKRRIFTSDFNPNLSAGQAKRVGQNLDIRDDWDRVKLPIMRQLVYAKFLNDLTIRQQLVKTGDAYLEEGNTWHDIFWGVCHHKREGKTCREPAHRPFGGNHLGYLLMEVRTYFSAGTTYDKMLGRDIVV